jgi:hypothetical protein
MLITPVTTALRQVLMPLCLLLPVAFAARADVASASGAVATSAQKAAQTLEKITSAIGTPQCTQDQQCQTIAIGHKACGGPEYYLTWSSAHTSSTVLKKLAARYSKLREAEHARTGGLSTCILVTDPGAMCQVGQAGDAGDTGVCVLKTGGKGGALPAS